MIAARLQAGYQALLHPAARATLALETYGAAELRRHTEPLIFLVGDGQRVDRSLAVSGLPRTLRRRTVAVPELRQAERLLGRGWNVVVSGDDPAGVAAVAVRLRVPIIPVGVRGTVAAVEPGRLLPRPGRPRVAIRYGLPLEPAIGETPAVLAVRAAQAVRSLIAEDSATWWAVRRHRVDEAATAPGGWRRTWQQTERPLIGGRRAPRKIWQR
ncbi:hypothetical protein [Microlunatus speluncae]|uniref:hypothetical protein n=1 Tax=Microlunatus speluncae TaxID=2594267 RepID=UPI0012661F93|nr:hypothetical protein [Microlunatus speluncae]